jgi:hypothetical protein
MSSADESPTSDVPLTPGRFGVESRLDPIPEWAMRSYALGGPVAGGPASTGVNVGEIGPLLRAGPAESALTKVARVFAIIRDLLIILLIVAALTLGAKIIKGVGDGLRPAVAPTPCTAPTVDGFGSFCADTPGG